MSKRKKKSKRRKDAAIRTFGLKDDVKTAPLYQSSFQESDMGWLADEYQRRARSEPTLTLEDFAAEYGVSADTLRFHDDDYERRGNAVYAFRHTCITSNVIEEITEIQR